MDKVITPEQYWQKVKDKIYGGIAPEIIESKMQQGFRESLSESEKFQRITLFMLAYAKINKIDIKI